MSVNGLRDRYDKKRSVRSAIKPSEDLFFLSFGHGNASESLPCFLGEITALSLGFSDKIMTHDMCVGGNEIKANFTAEPKFASYSEENVSNKNMQGLREVCDEPKYSVLLTFPGTYFEHGEVCKAFYGGLQYSIASFPDFINGNTMAQCDGPAWFLSWFSFDQRNSSCYVGYINGTHTISYCNRKLRCSICIFPQTLLINLFGPIKHFDSTFKVMTDGKGNLTFNGTHSQMYRKNGSWTLKSHISEAILTNKESLVPLGRKNWTVENCSDCPNQQVELAFSLCMQQEFCCSDGQCITQQNARCDGVVQCKDGSDELLCDHVVEDIGYQKQQMPSSEMIINGQTTEAFHAAYSLNIKHISDISSSNGKFTLDFEMTVRWKDGRLTLKNVNSNSFTADNIWKPEFEYYATHSEGDAVLPESQVYTLSAQLIGQTEPAFDLSDSYMGEIKL